MTNPIVRLFLLLLIVATAADAANAQSASTFVGLVTDSTGAAVPKAKITATNVATGLVRQTETNDLGEYVLPLLPPGDYKLSAEAPGFDTAVRTSVNVLVNQTRKVDLSLVVGKLKTEVVVAGDPTAVNTVNAALGGVITRDEVQNLPLNGRNFLQLSTLVPGAVPGIQLTENFTPTTQGSSLNVPQVNGMRSQSNNVLLDGVSNNELFLGQAAAIPAPDSIQEFSIQTNLYGAEFGKGAGSVVNVVTRGGTDVFHGSLYNYFRNDVLDARNYFSPGVPPLKRNQFGGSFGGPIIKTKTHFFSSYEGMRLREGTTRTAAVPTALEKAGNFSQSAVRPTDPNTGLPFPGDIIPAGRIDPVASALLQFYPDPNLGTNLFTSSPSAPTDLDQLMFRLDHTLSQKDTLFGRYFWQDGRATSPFSTAFLGSIDVPAFPLRNEWRFQHLVLGETHVFSPTSVNEIRVGYIRSALTGLVPATPRSASDFGFQYPSTTPIDVPQVAVAGFSVIGFTDMGPGVKTTNEYQIVDTFSHVRGRHAFKFGGEVKRNQLNGNIASAFNGAYNFSGLVTGNSFADFLLGQPLFFIQGGGNSALRFRSWNFGFFGEDQITLQPNLKLTLGLRYELPTWPVEVDNRISTFRAGQQSTVRPDAPVGLVYPGDSGIPRATIENDRTNFAPRIGIAWDPTSKGKMSVRAGYGIFYDSIPWHNVYQLQIAPPFSFFQFLFLPPSFANPSQGNAPFQPGLLEIPFSQIPTPFQYNIFNPDAVTPYAQQWNLTLENEFLPTWTGTASYVGTTGVHLPSTLDINEAAVVPGAGFDSVNSRRPFAPNFASILAQSTAWNSNYNALQLNLNKRPQHGLSFLAAYTWSKAIDTISTPQAFRNTKGQQTMPMSSFNIGLDRGPAAFDVRHRFVFSYLYEFPRYSGEGALEKVLSGWALNGIVSLQGGLPFTVLDPTDPTVDGNTNDRADLIGNPEGPETVEEWFNTAAFQRVPTGAGRHGTSGRNNLRGPGLSNWDFSIVKRTNLTERTKLEFRTEFFNFLNHPNFRVPVSDITSPNFGSIVETVPGNERQVQFVLRLDF